jgi:hypothetical protein
VAPANALGAIYDTKHKKGGGGSGSNGGSEVGATRAGVGVGAEAHAAESDWMREAMVNAARAAGDASLAGSLFKSSNSNSNSNGNNDADHAVSGSAARVAKQHHTWWFGSSRPQGLEKPSADGDAAAGGGGDLYSSEVGLYKSNPVNS